jgi:hypothetical protein
MAGTFTTQYCISRHPEKTRDRRLLFCGAKKQTAVKGFLKRRWGLGREENFFPQKKFSSLPKQSLAYFIFKAAIFVYWRF